MVDDIPASPHAPPPAPPPAPPTAPVGAPERQAPTSALRARRSLTILAFGTTTLVITLFVRTLISASGLVPGRDPVTTTFFGAIVAMAATLGYVAATDLLPVFPRHEEGGVVRCALLAAVVTTAIVESFVLSTEFLGPLACLLAATLLPFAGTMAWIVTWRVVKRAVGRNVLHPLGWGSVCVECGYDLRASVSRRCPECGTSRG
ncbi:MAG: hypothetical protein U0575_02030 [Phycisphaerales bacterium]